MTGRNAYQTKLNNVQPLEELCRINLWDFLKKKMMEHPNQIVCENNASMTYEELCVCAEFYAEKLKVGYYGILCKSELAATTLLLACFAAGKAAVPFPVRYGKEAYINIWNRAEPPFILTDFDGELSVLAVPSVAETNPPAPPAAVVLFDLEKSEEPTEILLSEEKLLSDIKESSSHFHIGAQDTTLISRPICHVSVLTNELLDSLCAGAKIVFSSKDPFSHEAKSLFEKLKKQVFKER